MSVLNKCIIYIFYNVYYSQRQIPTLLTKFITRPGWWWSPRGRAGYMNHPRVHLLRPLSSKHTVSKYIPYHVNTNVSLMACNLKSAPPSINATQPDATRRDAAPTLRAPACPLFRRERASTLRAHEQPLFVCVERLEMAESRDQSDNLGLQTRVRRHWYAETNRKWSRELLKICSRRWDTSRTRQKRIFGTRFGFSKLVS